MTPITTVPGPALTRCGGAPSTRARNRPPRPSPPQEGWLSTKDWRRAMRIAIERGLSRAERRELMSRLARPRRGGGTARPAPRLRVLAGGGAIASGTPFPCDPGPREAA